MWFRNLVFDTKGRIYTDMSEQGSTMDENYKMRRFMNRNARRLQLGSSSEND
jgi:hypothetical protein